MRISSNIKNLNLDIENIFKILTLVIFIAFSLYQVLTHVPFFDEINAWNIASYLKPSEIFEITRREGHLFIWYFLIKPFAQNDILYPYSMQILNWLFAVFAIIILWQKSPFNTLTKIFITFSLPIKVFYIHSRCYSIGLLLLFILCMMYKNRLKHPIWYSILLVLTANTSLMAGILAFCLGLCFIYDLYRGKSKNILTTKEIFWVVGICLTGAVVVILQLYNFVIPYYSANTFDYEKHFIQFYVGNPNKMLSLSLLSCHLWILALAWKFFEKTKLPFIFLTLSTYFYILLFLGIYRSSFWHFMFLFVAIIISLWIYLAEHDVTNDFQKRYLVVFTFMFVFLTFYHYRGEIVGAHMTFLEDIQRHSNIYKEHKIFMFPTDSSVIGIVPVLRKSNYKFYNCLGNSYKSVQLYKHQWDEPKVDFDNMLKLLKEDESAYVFVSVAPPHDEANDAFNRYVTLYKYKNKKSDIKLLKRKYNVYIWKITKHDKI